MVLKYSGATYRPLSSKQTQPEMVAHDFVCYHTMAGYLTSTRKMFMENGFGGTESHFGVGGIWGGDVREKADGKCEQWQDLRYSADANYLGSRRVISVETADNAFRPIQGWTPKQLDRLIHLGAEMCSLSFHRNCPSTWACRRGVMWQGIRVAIPPTIVPDTKPGRRGLAVHRQGCEHSLGVGAVPGYLVPGGVRWSTARGKDCPTDRRVAQFKQIVVPGIQARLKPAPPKPAPPTNPIPIPQPAPAPAEPTYLEMEDPVIYRITLSDDKAQFIVGLNGPGDVQHLPDTTIAGSFAKVFPTVVMRKADLLRHYHVPLWEDALPPTEGA